MARYYIQPSVDIDIDGRANNFLKKGKQIEVSEAIFNMLGKRFLNTVTGKVDERIIETNIVEGLSMYLDKIKKDKEIKEEKKEKPKRKYTKRKKSK